MAEDTQEQMQAEERWYELSLEERRARLPRQLAGMQLVLELPARLIDREDLLAAATDLTNQTATRVLSAALMLSWPTAQRKAGVPRYKGDVLDYGGQIFDFLLGHGATRADVLRAGGVALSLSNEATVAQHLAQEEARGNSRTPGGGPGSSSSSPSSSGPGFPSAVASAALTPK